jgi:hypothetical protein
MPARLHHRHPATDDAIRRHQSADDATTRDDGAMSAEYLMWIAIAVGIAITIGVIINALLVAKAHSIKLN